MKLVIQTQIRENYAAHEGFDGSYRWKYKGGNTYIVRGISVANGMKIAENGIPNLTKLITETGDYYQEYIIDWSLLDDCEEDPVEKWDSPIELGYDAELGWVATRHHDNTGDYCYMRREIASKTESWVILEGNERKEGSYKAIYTMRDGQVLDYQGLEDFYKEAA